MTWRMSSATVGLRTYGISPLIPQDMSLPPSGFFVGAGAVVLSGNTISTPTTYISTKTSPVQLAVNNITQIYANPANGALASQVAVTEGVSPANSLAIAEGTDSTGLIRNIFDARPSYI